MYIQKIVPLPYRERTGIETKQINIMPGGFMGNRDSVGSEFIIIFRVKIIGINSSSHSAVIGLKNGNVSPQLSKLKCSGQTGKTSSDHPDFYTL